MKTILWTTLIFALFWSTPQFAQVANKINFSVADEQGHAIPSASVQIFKQPNEKAIFQDLTDQHGNVQFSFSQKGSYYYKIKSIGFDSIGPIQFEYLGADLNLHIKLKTTVQTLLGVTISGKKDLVERREGKTIVNVESSPTLAGANVLEILERSPGVMLDRNGNISLQGKNSVLVLIDDKPTYLGAAELNSMLSSMNASQINAIEIITSPSAKYDASGNAGIINIKTKKNRQDGFNGSVNLNLGSGKHWKSNENLQLNLRKGKINTFLNYLNAYNKGFMSIDAQRAYFDTNGQVRSALIQPSFLGNLNKNNNLRLGLDYLASDKITLGFTVNGNFITREGKGNATAYWQNAQMQTDSSILTNSETENKLNNLAFNMYGRHQLSATKSLSFDADFAHYQATNHQLFTNQKTGIGGYLEASRGDIPTEIKIYALKADYTWDISADQKLELGLKTSTIHTDNTANYTKFTEGTWTDDLIKSNHFLYQESIHSAYVNFNQKLKNFQYQLGLRYENTDYEGEQLGNASQAGSTFSRTYHNLFPNAYLQYNLNENQVLSISAGRRIDRPSYNKLNPFIFIINKFTHQKGNPYFLPQHTWNLELQHSYKNMLFVSLNYSHIKNFFSQIFLNEGNDILVYTEGNVGKMEQMGAFIGLQIKPFKWWNINLQSNYNYKDMQGFANSNYSGNVHQIHSTMNNQFSLNKTLTAELSGFYTGRARNDIQEVLVPTGQLTIGFSQSLWKGKGSLRLTARDVLYTQIMKGETDFPDAFESFSLWRDSRIFNVGFQYKFGKTLKAPKRSSGGAAEELNRANN
ncbi:MAG: hypothetical protein EOO99_00430 [Pedobacter sp.]|nr:MAG: hypothetical protein EOO99_00430 [Pedobacter sp.]